MMKIRISPDVAPPNSDYLDSPPNSTGMEAAFPPPILRPQYDPRLVATLLESVAGNWKHLDGFRVISLVANAIIAAHPGDTSPEDRLSNVILELFDNGKAEGRPHKDLRSILMRMAELYVKDRSLDRSQSGRVVGKNLRRQPLGHLSINNIATEVVMSMHPELDEKERASLELAAAAAFSRDRDFLIISMKHAAKQIDPAYFVASAIGHLLAACGVKIETRRLEPPRYHDWSAKDAGD